MISYKDELYHHGIKGQRWGVRRYQKKNGRLTAQGAARYTKKNLAKARSFNVDKWGSSDQTNVMYIAGYSGSGKSTAASSIAKKGDSVIHLDGYSEYGLSSLQNKNFNNYLDQHVPSWKSIAIKQGSKDQFNSKSYWDTVDAFAKAIEDYGREEHRKGHRVIAEGVQIADGWLREDKSFYASKPTIILGTSGLSSLVRASRRDNITISNSISKVKWYINAWRNLNDLSEKSNAVKGQTWVGDYLNTHKKG